MSIKGSSAMLLQDLGQLDAPLLLFGGPYSNRHAMRALIQKAQELGILRGHMICTGGIVAYGGEPAALRS